MRWLFRCLYVVTEYKTLIEVAYATLVISSLVRLIVNKTSAVFTLRDRLGASGLVVGACSGALLAWFYIYLWIEHSVIAHGSALFIYYAVGSCAAVAGAILALTGRGWVRRSASIVSFVMMLQWLEMWSMSIGLDQWITIATFFSLVAWGVMSLAVRHSAQRPGAAQPRVSA
jgi:hypothetical protein